MQFATARHQSARCAASGNNNCSGGALQSTSSIELKADQAPKSRDNSPDIPRHRPPHLDRDWRELVSGSRNQQPTRRPNGLDTPREYRTPDASDTRRPPCRQGWLRCQLHVHPTRLDDEEAPNTADSKSRSLYRRSLKLALDWSVHRHLWRGQAVYIRSLFENNRDVSDPRLQRVRNTLLAGRRRGEYRWAWIGG